MLNTTHLVTPPFEEPEEVDLVLTIQPLPFNSLPLLLNSLLLLHNILPLSFNTLLLPYNTKEGSLNSNPLSLSYNPLSLFYLPLLPSIAHLGSTNHLRRLLSLVHHQRGYRHLFSKILIQLGIGATALSYL